MAADKLSDEFILALQALFEWLEAEQVPGASIGGVAVSLIAQPRVTQDIDVLVWLEESRWETFIQSGRKYGIVPRINDALDFARQSRVLLLNHEPSSISIDVSLGALEFERELIERAVTLELGGLTMKVPTPEDLVITKAVAQRPKDLADIDAIASAVPDLDADRVRRWVRQFAEVLEMPGIADNIENVLRQHSALVNPPPRTKQTQKKARRKKDR
ncbi:MAG: nucleotidyltransferase [Acidobacteria bacterium]|nr:nucleotidyltransferase [Acidobacteriota bacterium]